MSTKGRWLMPYASLSDGNMKLGSVPSISLPPIKTCPKSPCHNDCYALQSYKQYPAVRRAWDRNLRRWKADPDRYFGSVIWQIRKRGIMLFRWHVAGDIPSRQYLQGMIKVAEAVPGTRFLCFTKRYDWLSGLKLPKNLSVVLSAWPGLPLPRTCRPIAFMQDGTEDRVKDAVSCPGGCQTCAKCWVLPSMKKNVVFPLHRGWIASLKARGLKRKTA